jgi:hypothetical protein
MMLGMPSTKKGRAQWDAEAVRDEHRQDVLAGFGQDDAVLAIDETSTGPGSTPSTSACSINERGSSGHSDRMAALFEPAGFVDDPGFGRLDVRQHLAADHPPEVVLIPGAIGHKLLQPVRKHLTE